MIRWLRDLRAWWRFRPLLRPCRYCGGVDGVNGCGGCGGRTGRPAQTFHVGDITITKPESIADIFAMHQRLADERSHD